MGVTVSISEVTDVFGATPNFDIIPIGEEFSIAAVIKHVQDVLLGVRAKVDATLLVFVVNEEKDADITEK